ncbi:heparinase II/III domain-containing protein [Paenibacillus rhizolycopersici]|uniref:heparinase II/III domain-containing protein n=1 Tax=Paenibacillus rhizolycopersici TaxID=2780073 RepID=UPI003D2A5DF7
MDVSGTMSEQLRIKINNFEPIYMLDKLSDNTYLQYADEILNNKLVVNEKITTTVEFDVLNLDWDMTVTESPNTFSLYLHTLRPIYYLCKAYLFTNNMAYLNIADEFLNSWTHYVENKKSPNRYAWYDHSVAERIENLLFFSIIKEHKKDTSGLRFIRKIIQINSEWLYKDENYTYKHNHGIFQDGSLIKAGYYLEAEEYIEKGISRLNNQLKHAFPNMYIHVENSIGYHLGIISYLKGITNFLHSYSNDYAKTADTYYKGAIEYLVYAYKPNLTVPYIGDTIGSVGKGKVKSDFDHENLKYIQSLGLVGQKPEMNFKFYKNDGTAIYREHWESSTFDQSTWLYFKSGYQSSTHKHADDLSFQLYSKGHDIFIDPGMYNYMVGNKIHDYMNSVYAHNTIIVDDQTYSISMFNSNKVGLLSLRKMKGYESVSGYNNIYKGIQIDRTINIIDGNNFLIVDDIVSDDHHKYSQIFHLSNDMDIISLTKDYTILKIKDTDFFLLLKQLHSIDQNNVYYADFDSKYLSFISTGLSKVNPTKTITYEKDSSSSTKFITFIKVVTSAELNKYVLESPIIEEDYVLVNGVCIDIKSRERLPIADIEAQINNNRLKLRNTASSNTQQISYAFYLLDKATGLKKDSTQYSFDSSAEFYLEKGNSYALISYIRNSAMETSRKLIGFIDYDKQHGFHFDKVSIENQEPSIGGSSIIKVNDDNIFKFTVNVSCVNGINSKWYIYRNGASYDFVGNNSNEFEYQFSEQGAYTCIYRIRDKYFGEIVFSHFNEIVIS